MNRFGTDIYDNFDIIVYYLKNMLLYYLYLFNLISFQKLSHTLFR